MSKFIIENSKNLKGEIEVYGAKNAAMKIIAASVLISGEVTLENVPDISDVQRIIDILVKNGAKISRDGHTLKIDTTNLIDKSPDEKLVKKFRGSIVLIGPYLSRFGRISIPQPGGCLIGSRPIDTHLKAFEKVGAEVSCQDNFNHLSLGKNIGGEVVLKEASVTATENIIMSQVIGPQETLIKNAATEPQIADLINFLNKAGAKISGANTRTIKIQGVDKLNPISYRVMPDPFEAATFVCMAVVTNSEIKITNCNPNDLYPFLNVIKEIGVKFELGENYVLVQNSQNLKSAKITTDIHPGFSTDMQASIGLILTQANGESYIHEKLFENRLGYLKELVEMGAKVEFISNQEAVITGPTLLHGRHIESLDLRAGATMILAGLAAVGQTIISDAEIVDRGYEKIETRLKRIGAKIERVDS